MFTIKEKVFTGVFVSTIDLFIVGDIDGDSFGDTDGDLVGGEF